MNRRDELDAMYLVLCRGCAGKICTLNCPGAEYDHCGEYNKAVMLYDAGWRRQIEAEREPITKINKQFAVSVIVGFNCSNCGTEQEVETNYCSNCGAKMSGRGWN